MRAVAVDETLVAMPVPPDSSNGEPNAKAKCTTTRRVGWGRTVNRAAPPPTTPKQQLQQSDCLKQLQALQQETDNAINHNQQELQGAIIQQEQRMQALPDQQALNMQQVNATVTDMQHGIGQLDATISTLNATMTAQPSK